MKYKVVRTRSAAGLEEEVNRLLRQGWQLLGGVSAAWLGDSYMFMQAMTKETP